MALTARSFELEVILRPLKALSSKRLAIGIFYVSYIYDVSTQFYIMHIHGRRVFSQRIAAAPGRIAHNGRDSPANIQKKREQSHALYIYYLYIILIYNIHDIAAKHRDERDEREFGLDSGGNVCDGCGSNGIAGVCHVNEC